ncbi:MAG: hypothetical protein AAGI23_16455 [Bacteroidota bacterium]
MLKSTLLKEASYDSTAVLAIKNFSKIFPDYWSIPSNKDFISWCATDYYLLPIGLAGIAVVYVRQKRWKKLAYVYGAFFAYLLLINVSLYQGFPQFHIESYYLPLSIVVIIPLVFDVLPTIKNKSVLLVLLALVLSIRVVHIWNRHELYTARV